MMFSVPIFTISTYKDDNNSFEFGLEMIKEFENNTIGFNATFSSYVKEHKDIRTPLIVVNAKESSWESNKNVS